MCRYLTLAAVLLLATSPLSKCRGGDVTVQKKGGDILIASVDPGSDDIIVIQEVSIWRDYFRIINLNGTIWGQKEVLLPIPDTMDLTIELGDGNDTVEIQNNIKFRNVFIDVGADQSSARDHDTVNIESLNYTGVFTIETGPGEDDVYLSGVHCNRDALGFKYLWINTGDGPDKVTIASSFYLAPFVFITTYGSAADPAIDEVTVDSVLADYMWVNLGGGNDVAVLRDVDSESVLVNAGQNDDDVAFSYCSIRSITAKMEAGNDDLLLFEVGVDKLQAHGGDGTDWLDRDELRVSQGGSSTKSGWEYYEGRRVYAKIQTGRFQTFRAYQMR